MGAQRSGSSWWFRVALDSHPRVVRCDEGLKELHFFDRFCNGGVPADLAERYHRFFPRPEGALTGEWTPRYMYDHWSMRLLHEAAPETRILIILRDPIERYRSALEAWRRVAMTRGRRMEQLAGAVSRSAYLAQVRRVFDLFPRERVLVLQYERCVADPMGEIERTWRFLGLDPTATPKDGPTEEVRAPRKKPELPADVLVDLHARLRPDVDGLAALCPEIDVSLWKNFAEAPGPTAPPSR